MQRISAYCTLLALPLLVASPGCTIRDASAPPLLVASHQAVGISKRERGYFACVTALHQAHAPRDDFRLKGSYQSKVDEDNGERFYRIGAFRMEKGVRKQVDFECTTSPSFSPRILSLYRVSSLDT
ncbi:MAG: hypothetical protein KDI31_01150 [Pseudomonadales bacterium]|nr:hypothetical protein [Pseudomonadales bacterium]